MDVEMAYVQDSFLTNDVLQEMVSNLHVAATPGFSLVWSEIPSPYVAKLSIILSQLSQGRDAMFTPTTPDWVNILYVCHS